MQQSNNLFIIKAGGSKVAITFETLHAFKEIQQSHSFQNESGGIVAGYYDSSFEGIVISDITNPQENDTCSRFKFMRRSKGHQEIMDKLWEDSGHRKSYLGEWHTHDQDSPVPSWIDTASWKKISKKPQNFEELFFVIIGRKAIGIWSFKNGTLAGNDFISEGA